MRRLPSRRRGICRMIICPTYDPFIRPAVLFMPRQAACRLTAYVQSINIRLFRSPFVLSAPFYVGFWPFKGFRPLSSSPRTGRSSARYTYGHISNQAPGESASRPCCDNLPDVHKTHFVVYNQILYAIYSVLSLVYGKIIQYLPLLTKERVAHD